MRSIIIPVFKLEPEFFTLEKGEYIDRLSWQVTSEGLVICVSIDYSENLEKL